MKTILTIILSVSFFTMQAQNRISGKAVTEKGEPLPGVNIFIENTYDGASSDADGNFSFTTSETGLKTLKATFIGFKPWQKELNITENIQVEIELKESVNTLNSVTITAGSFAAADESRASKMEPLDIYTTASANADVMAAVRTMPGTQAAADDGRLMVRGGDVYETKTYIDGLIAAKPYYSKTPDIATRGRFAPSLFNGVMFNTGGYSAEYGQALSSVLILNSNDLAEEDVTGISIMTIGAEASTAQRMKNSSVGLTGSYTNLIWYDNLFNSSVDWEKPVEAVNGTAVYRYKTKSNGMFKGYFTADYGNLSYNIPTATEKQQMLITNRGLTTYSNFLFRDCFSEKSCYKIGVSVTTENNKLGLYTVSLNTIELNVETRFTVVHDVSEEVKITWGANETFNRFNEDYILYQGQTYSTDFADHLFGGFFESEIKFTKNLAIRPGLRSEYSSVINKWNLAPRFAVALKTGKEAQISGTWGLYHQTPQSEYLKLYTNLDFEKAMHCILSYQYGKVSERLFRAEAYYKTYNDLITWQTGDFGLPTSLKNDGGGYAGGIDIFWRDRKSISGFDYWVTYSYIDTKRKYQNFPEQATPGFISDHTFSVVGKYWLHKINTLAGASFTAASGRPYNDPNSSGFMKEKLKAYIDLSLNLSHIFYIGNQYSVLYCSVNNVLGNDNVLSYRPAGIADAQGNYSLIPVKRDLKRFVFIGLFLNF
ncbi:MAG: TonB-dependent receptor [Prolixibacteraceae bacterium]|nr:MAG: TonB-dependent receptor [Prolixibacteraceae bacterium]